MEDNTKEP